MELRRGGTLRSAIVFVTELYLTEYPNLDVGYPLSVADSDYGETGYNSIKEKVEGSKKICLAEPIVIYNAHFKKADYKDIIRLVRSIEMRIDNLVTRRCNSCKEFTPLVFEID